MNNKNINFRDELDETVREMTGSDIVPPMDRERTEAEVPMVETKPMDDYSNIDWTKGIVLGRDTDLESGDINSARQVKALSEGMVPTLDKPSDKLGDLQSISEEYNRLMSERDSLIGKQREEDRNKLALGYGLDALTTLATAPQMRYAKNANIKMPENSIAAMMKDLGRSKDTDSDYKAKLQTLASQYKVLTDAQKLDLNARMADVKKKDIDADNARADEAVDNNKKFKDYQMKVGISKLEDLSPKESEAIQDMNAGRDRLTDIKEAWEKLKKGVGYGSKQFQSFSEMLRSGDPEIGKLYALINENVSLYGKALSGSAIAEPEFKRLEMQQPGADMSPAVFDALVNQNISKFDDRYSRFLHTKSRGGKNVAPYLKPQDLQNFERLDKEYVSSAKSYRDDSVGLDKPALPSQVKEVKKKDMKSGKTAVFNADTKQFIRWE